MTKLINLCSTLFCSSSAANKLAQWTLLLGNCYCAKLAGLFAAAAAAAAPKLTKPYRWRAYYWRINNILSLLLLHWFTRVVNGPATIWPISGCFNVWTSTFFFFLCELGSGDKLCAGVVAGVLRVHCHSAISSSPLSLTESNCCLLFSVQNEKLSVSLLVSLFGACWQQQQWPTTTTSLWDSVSVSNWNWWRNRFAADSPLKSTTLVSLLGNGMEEGRGGADK